MRNIFLKSKRREASHLDNSYDFSTSSEFWSEEESFDGFSARELTRIPNLQIVPDHDIWVEHFSVVENSREIGKKKLRSYFESVSTGRRNWDEPPTGASSIRYASDHTRQMAGMQLNGLILTGDVTSEIHTKKGILDKIKSLVFKEKKRRNLPREATTENTACIPDRDVQSAIALSLNMESNEGCIISGPFLNVVQSKVLESSRKEHSPTIVSSSRQDELFSQNIEEDMEMATALSLSLVN